MATKEAQVFRRSPEQVRRTLELRRSSAARPHRNRRRAPGARGEVRRLAIRDGS